MMYDVESRAFDVEILRVIGAWSRGSDAFGEAEFDDLALRLFDYQMRYDRPYARYCASLGFSPSAPPNSWQCIPAAPAAAFKEAALATFDPSNAALAFATSGTTGGRTGRHFFETRTLYDAALLAAFDRFMLPDGVRLRYFNLVPNPSERPESSLGYMMQHVSLARGDGKTGWYVRGEELAFDALLDGIRAAIADRQAVCIAATAFALVHVLDHLERHTLRITLPPGSRVMETGGFKGRARSVERKDLYRSLCDCFGLHPSDIVAEYGMTELTSQYYDDVLIRANSVPEAVRTKVAPPWLRTRVVGPDGKTLPYGTVGALVHVDLANRSSCIAVATEDLGLQLDPSASPGSAGIVLIGREPDAALRGCSLDAESLRRA
jgi:hypothetical protein